MRLIRHRVSCSALSFSVPQYVTFLWSTPLAFDLSPDLRWDHFMYFAINVKQFHISNYSIKILKYSTTITETKQSKTIHKRSKLLMFLSNTFNLCSYAFFLTLTLFSALYIFHVKLMMSTEKTHFTFHSSHFT